MTKLLTKDERRIVRSIILARLAAGDEMTEHYAIELSRGERDYFPKCIRGRWFVWSRKADHAVEF